MDETLDFLAIRFAPTDATRYSNSLKNKIKLQNFSVKVVPDIEYVDFEKAVNDVKYKNLRWNMFLENFEQAQFLQKYWQSEGI